MAPLSIRSDHLLPLQQSDRIDTAGNVDLEAGVRGGDRTAGRVDDERTQGVVLHLEIDLPSQQGQAALTAPVLHLEVAIGIQHDLGAIIQHDGRSEEHTSELQSLMRISYAVFCLKKKKQHSNTDIHTINTS